MNAWERMIANAEAAALQDELERQQSQQREANAKRAAVAYERMGGLARSIDATIAAGLRNPNLDNKPRLQELRSAMHEAEDTISRGRERC